MKSLIALTLWTLWCPLAMGQRETREMRLDRALDKWEVKLIRATRSSARTALESRRSEPKSDRSSEPEGQNVVLAKAKEN